MLISSSELPCDRAEDLRITLSMEHDRDLQISVSEFAARNINRGNPA